MEITTVNEWMEWAHEQQIYSRENDKKFTPRERYDVNITQPFDAFSGIAEKYNMRAWTFDNGSRQYQCCLDESSPELDALVKAEPAIGFIDTRGGKFAYFITPILSRISEI